MEKGLLVVVSGFSGAGKGTLMKALIDHYDNYALSVSATTRAPREGEVHGKDYFFISREEFERRIGEGDFIEHALYVGNYYGTPKSFVQQKLDAGTDVILEIDSEGGAQIRKIFPDAVLIFVVTKDVGTLVSRLRKRGTENEEQIRARLRKAETEADRAEQYDYLLVNDDLDDALRQLHGIIQSEHRKVRHCLGLMAELRRDLHTFNHTDREE